MWGSERSASPWGIPLKTVADAYGSLDLLPEEIRELARLSLPAEIDLGPYRRRR